ncbi:MULTISPECIES: CinA family protein [unclassified Breznakia]|uniref:CinA family protein n=1 Tax=unclassified Breznakia TaxID=2623764 RepID=UPI002474FD61|nr:MULTISPECIES: CinA family protein [unclassified Breznakia]MDH6367213.1 nicotinamide-nucleotide amidase [Breznakia sp. PH1-1]MDH6404367.1 nicotinamide-nucleotide amidase [Breznakia sp. PF1-11]MDH6412076.1 nicotinamide-nucleotide amidase [Breznakia sp. PFB1-11]MDH6414355.1 nicotinamide-nucleotide amidase [Breznakia sp. PFB1-14]MDH6416715.1 nicotinamide-nucleotide amidase [Breznakia sp. PFB1-4]
MKELVAKLQQHQLTIATVESLTGGLLCAKISEVPGASKVLKGGFVTYMSEVKEHVLGIDHNLIETYGVVSKECAKAMAIQGAKQIEANIVLSCTGNAGPDVLEGKAVGLVDMAIYYDKNVYVFEEIFPGNRNEVREQVCAYLAHKVLDILGK